MLFLRRGEDGEGERYGLVNTHSVSNLKQYKTRGLWGLCGHRHMAGTILKLFKAYFSLWVSTRRGSDTESTVFSLSHCCSYWLLNSLSHIHLSFHSVISSSWVYCSSKGSVGRISRQISNFGMRRFRRACADGSVDGSRTAASTWTQQPAEWPAHYQTSPTPRLWSLRLHSNQQAGNHPYSDDTRCRWGRYKKRAGWVFRPFLLGTVFLTIVL